MRRAFTLIEFLVIIAIIGLMVTVTVVSASGKSGAARLRGAARDVFSVMRRARSTALMTQQPVIVKYSCETIEDEPVTKIEITSAKLMADIPSRGEIQKLTGGYLAPEEGDGDGPGEGEGISVEDWLFEQIPEDVVKGVRIKAVLTEDGDAYSPGTEKKRTVSTWSNTDFLLAKYRDARKKSSEKKNATSEEASDTPDSKTADEDQEEIAVVWQSNGRVKPHQVWIYLDGMDPGEGISIKADRFGGVKILARGEED